MNLHKFVMRGSVAQHGLRESNIFIREDWLFRIKEF